ncbi:C40 family peptidase [Enterobacteriaceae bacterium BIT-l23]|nr:C40 family peptidase [Enterobacteriaceae bacterium BIT-l23]
MVESNFRHHLGSTDAYCQQIICSRQGKILRSCHCENRAFCAAMKQETAQMKPYRNRILGPGEVIFFQTIDGAHNVGIYIGNGEFMNVRFHHRVPLSGRKNAGSWSRFYGSPYYRIS